MHPKPSDASLSIACTSIEATVVMGAVKKADLQRVIVDTALQEKAIARPSDSRLLEVARAKIESLARSAGHQLDAAQELDPKGLCFTGSDLQPAHLAMAHSLHTEP